MRLGLKFICLGFENVLYPGLRVAIEGRKPTYGLGKWVFSIFLKDSSLFTCQETEISFELHPALTEDGP
jgi:hypothetical protein